MREEFGCGYSLNAGLWLAVPVPNNGRQYTAPQQQFDAFAQRYAENVTKRFASIINIYYFVLWLRVAFAATDFDQCAARA